MPTPCVLLTPTGRERRSLRRYASRHSNEPPYGPVPEAACAASGMGYHNAHAALDDGPTEGGVIGDTWPHNDPRWPTHCACGYQFAEDDQWQLFRDTLYAAPDGTEHTMRERPAGALVDATWLHGVRHYTDRSPDGMVLILRLPDGKDWLIEDQAQGGGHWTRTGTPPAITATPSIDSGTYHGWLQAGVLSDDLGGRTYPPAAS